MKAEKVPETISELIAFCFDHNIVPEDYKIRIGYKDSGSHYTYIIRNKQKKCEVYKNNLIGVGKLLYIGSEESACEMIFNLLTKNITPKCETKKVKKFKYLKPVIGVFIFAFSLLFTMNKIIDHQYGKKFEHNYDVYAPSNEPSIGYYIYSGKLFFKDMFNWHILNTRDGLWYTEESVSEELQNNSSNYQTYKEDLIGQGNFSPFDWTDRPKGDSYDDSSPLDFLSGEQTY